MSISAGVGHGATEHWFDFQTFSVITKQFQVFLGKSIYCWTAGICSMPNQQSMTKVSSVNHLRQTHTGTLAAMLDATPVLT